MKTLLLIGLVLPVVLLAACISESRGHAHHDDPLRATAQSALPPCTDEADGQSSAPASVNVDAAAIVDDAGIDAGPPTTCLEPLPADVDVRVDCQQGTGDGADQTACNAYRTDRGPAGVVGDAGDAGVGVVGQLIFSCGFFEAGKPTYCGYAIPWAGTIPAPTNAQPTRELILQIWRSNWDAFCQKMTFNPPFCVTHPTADQCKPHGL